MARELRAAAGLGVERYADLHVPGLVLGGQASPPSMRALVTALAGTLPDAQMAWLAGHGHVAHATAPAVVADAVAAFLKRVR